MEKYKYSLVDRITTLQSVEAETLDEALTKLNGEFQILNDFKQMAIVKELNTGQVFGITWQKI